MDILKVKVGGEWIGIPSIKGNTGTTFTPAVSDDGVISWTNDDGKPNPESVNIKGPKGDTGDPAPAASITTAVDAYLGANFSNPSNPPLDRTLASSSSAAPADMVGELKSAATATSFVPTLTWTLGKGISNAGVGDNAYTALTDMILCQSGDRVVNKSPSSDGTNSFTFYVGMFKTTSTPNDTFYARQSVVAGASYVIPNDITGIRISAGRITSSGVTIQSSDLSYFSFEFYIKGTSLELGREMNKTLNEITEPTRNLNTAGMGRYKNNSDGKIYDSDNKYWGMNSFIPVTAGESYTISNSGLTSSTQVKFTYLFNDDSGNVISRAGYTNNNTRTITVPTGATKLNLFFYSDNAITAESGAYVQIEHGSTQTKYVQPQSAIDAELRENLVEYPTYRFTSVMGGILNIAEKYFDEAYNSENNLVYDSTHGLFNQQTTSDNDGEEGHPAIVCSQFAWAMMKFITWENSRYVDSVNHVGQSCFTSDGVDQAGNSYYAYIKYPDFLIDDDDVPSHDYMLAEDTFRYAEDRGFGYEIKELYPQIRPGDLIFSTSEDSGRYKDITHVALCLYVGHDNKRVLLLESNEFQYESLTNVGVGVRNSLISYNKYGARYPIPALEHEAKLLEKYGAISVTNSTNYTLGTPFTLTHPKGFYTIIIKGTLPYSKTPQIGVLYSGKESRTFYRILDNGNTHIAFFYAPASFDSITVGIDTGSTVNISECKLYKGYVPME